MMMGHSAPPSLCDPPPLYAPPDNGFWGVELPVGSSISGGGVVNSLTLDIIPPNKSDRVLMPAVWCGSGTNQDHTALLIHASCSTGVRSNK